jgi:hypothetical protein
MNVSGTHRRRLVLAAALSLALAGAAVAVAAPALVAPGGLGKIRDFRIVRGG